MPANSSIHILGPIKPEYRDILTPSALSFLTHLHEKFNGTRLKLLDARKQYQQQIDSGVFPSYLSETSKIRDDLNWKGPKLAPGLVDRRVEITGPVDRKMVINALNSGATQFMADLEDSNSPTWTNCMDGQVNLKDAINRKIEMTSSNGKHYQLKEKVAVLLVRPRGWHLDEKHVTIQGVPMSASIFDFALYFFHNAKKTVEIGQGPYFYLPKMEHYLEARLWSEIFSESEKYLGMTHGTIRATCLIETITAAFQMEEIIYELRDYSSGLNCGRWDYIFSVIKKFRSHKSFILPDRSQVTMTSPFMSAYVKHLIYVCHKRGVHAMGGMAAQIPIRTDSVANDKAMEKVRSDKLREVLAGHDGTWVAHPDLIPLTLEIFNEHMPTANQIDKNSNPSMKGEVTEKDLLNVSTQGSVITEIGVRNNISVALQYMDAWLRGYGCVPINHLMEDAATAEISRAQLWQWLHHSVSVGDDAQNLGSEGRNLDKEWLDQILEEELSKLKTKASSDGNYSESKLGLAFSKLKESIYAQEFPEFLTIMCYNNILTIVDSPMQHKL